MATSLPQSVACRKTRERSYTTHERFADEVGLEAYIARFLPGDDIFARLKETLIELGVERMAIVSAIGSVKDVEFRDLKPGIELPLALEKTNLIQEEGPFELLSLEGNVVPMEGEPVLHLHALLGTPDGHVIGGHLFKATVFSTAEITFVALRGATVFKEKSDITGLTEMRI